MTRFCATLSYDGTAYNGYQVQPEVNTIQGKVEDALKNIFKHPVKVDAAGRTDTGVHATGQVIAFDAEWKHGNDALLRAVNSQLPEDIAVQDIWQQIDFHPRFDALSRTYRYHVAVVEVRQPLLARRAWQMQQQLDDFVLQQTAQYLIGEHDFATFGNPPQGNNTVRTIFRSAWNKEQKPYGTQYLYEVEATAFLHHMVRRLVGLQIAVANGQITVEAFKVIFQNCDLSQNKWIAPPYGLTLTKVKYPPAGVSRDEYVNTQGQSN